MKKIILSVIIGLVASVSRAEVDAIRVTYPNGGEVITRNSNLEVGWIAPVPQAVTIFADGYADGVRVSSVEIVRYYRFEDGEHRISSHASYSIHRPGTYKVRIVGEKIDGSVTVDESDAVFTVSEEGVATCNPTDNFWVQGESQEFTMVWDPAAVGHRYQVLFLNITEYLGEGYGFLLHSGIVGSENEPLSFTTPFLSTAMSAWPQYSLSSPVSGLYRVLVVDLETYGRSWSEETIYVSADDVFVMATPRPPINIGVGESEWYLKMSVNAGFSSADVHAITVPLIAWVESSNTLISVTLEDGDGKKVSQSRLVNKAPKYTEFTLRTTGFELPAGRSDKLFVVCRVIRGDGRFDIGLHGEGSAVAKGHQPLTSHFVHQWGNGATIVPKVP